MNLTSRRLEAHGLYLIEDGQNMFLWLGKNAVPALVNDAFGLNSYEEVRAGKVSLHYVHFAAESDSMLTTFMYPDSSDHTAATRERLLAKTQCYYWQDS